MAEAARTEIFIAKYQDKEKIWSGKSFTDCLGLRTLLAELPISKVPGPSKDFPHIYVGILENVFGQVMHTLVTCEGILHDRHAHILECSIRPALRADNVTLEFNIRYKTNKGEERSKSYEVIRGGERSFIFYY
ncbi:MAG: hypothetical protein JRI57_09355 [Deltaproteobacteria bacterium]|nr:hypothetical protein [Deltaproteobacteria bacterium]MBW1952373.1 hypothetical protein [Deltaproteobacteria bacterium]MBW1986485.1 hypothetical protein [Deltaproteobacteria bacterium]MBW2135459.1 hypothetical protein [Deltaproteobacteria bacterium]